MAALKVVIAVDGSKNADLAFRYYVDHFHRPQNEVIALYTTPPVMSPLYSKKYSALTEDLKSSLHIERDNHAAEVKEIYDKLATDIDKYSFYHLTDVERPGAGICQFVKENKCDSVVIGSRGMGVVKRTILGSVSDYVIHHAHVPVTVVNQ